MSAILLTQDEINDLKRLCNDPNIELGMMMRPKHLECLEPKIAVNTMMVIISFNTHETAKKWNLIHEERIRIGGHLATISIAMLAGLISKSYIVGVASSATMGMVKDELQTRIWYPEVFKGWLLTRYYSFRYEQFPAQNLYMEWTDMIQNEKGVEQEKKKHGVHHCPVGGPNGIPEKLVHDLIAGMPKFRAYNFE